ERALELLDAELLLEARRPLRRPEQALRPEAVVAEAGRLLYRLVSHLPLQRAFLPDEDVGDEQDEDEEGELREAEPAERVELHGERIEKDDLDVEDDEQHRGEVEAHVEALRLHRPLRDARLERHRARARPPRRPLRELEGHDEHRARNSEREDPVDEEWQPAVEHVARLPLPVRARARTHRTADVINADRAARTGTESA